MKTVFDIKKCGAVGDGWADDYAVIQQALTDAVATNGCLSIPPGLYRITQALYVPDSKARLSIQGYGQNNSIILCDNCAGISLCFEQHGIQQPFGVSMRDFSVRALGKCGTGIRVSYGAPPITNDHVHESVSLTNVSVLSDPEGTWDNGIELGGAWNANLSNVYASGDSCGGNWNAMRGAGLNLVGMCVNCHVSDSKFNFWAEGIRAHAENGRNTEGLFVGNTSMVAVQRGVWIKGDPALDGTSRISTLTWVGGLIELRVGGVTSVSAAFYLEHIWTGLISACQMITEMLPEPPKYTYGVLLGHAEGVVVSACDINAFNFGLHTVPEAPCVAVAATGCTFTNTEKQVVFAAGCTASRSYGHVLVNNAPWEWSESETNMMGFVN